MDFTEATANDSSFAKARSSPAKEIEWPVSLHLAQCGFEDSFRRVHKNPLKNYGITWSPGYPKGILNGDEIHDRIDFIYIRGGDGWSFRAVDSYLVDKAPEPLAYPSDHRAVVTRLVVFRENKDAHGKMLYPFSLH